MICQNCGMNYPDQNPYCPNCGAAAMQNLYMPAMPEVQEKPKRKGMILVSLILTIVCMAVLVASYFVAMNTSLEDISVVKLISSAMDEEALEDLEAVKDDMKVAYEDMKDQMDTLEDELSSKDYKKAEKFLKSLKALTNSISIQNMKNILADAEALTTIDEVDALDIDDEIETLDEISQIMNIISVVVLAAMLLCLAFCAFGGFFRVGGLVITGLVFSLLYGLIFCGFLFMALFAVVDIALAVVISKSKQ